MKTRSLFLSHNRQWALFRGAVRGVLTKLLFQKTKRSAFKTWGQGKSLLLLHLEEPAISIQPAFLAYRLPLCLLYLFSFFFFFFFSPCGKKCVAQVRLQLEGLLFRECFACTSERDLKKKKKKKNSQSLDVYLLPTRIRIQIIKDHQHQYTWATGILARITSCWPLASVTGTAGEWSRLTH